MFYISLRSGKFRIMYKKWQPGKNDIEKVLAQAKSLGAKTILDVGGNRVFTLPGAVSAGWEGEIKVDLNCDTLPFGDKEVDFVYSRHTIEDLAYPAHILREMNRVGKAGYIETPSIKAELTRGVDACGYHRGYAHHRWYVTPSDDTLVLIAKYPVTERYVGIDVGLDCLEWWTGLRDDEWNSQFFWQDTLKFVVREHESGLKVSEWDAHAPRSYLNFIIEALIDQHFSVSEEFANRQASASQRR